MAGPRYWWQERVDDDGGETVVAATPERRSPAVRAAPDLDRLRRYRAELIRKAALQRRGGASRRATEKTLARVTADILRLELGAR